MKKILVLILMMLLVGCDQVSTTQETTSLETSTTQTSTFEDKSYLSFSHLFIATPSRQLSQEEDVYYLYFYSETCMSCYTIKNEALSLIELLENDQIYLCEADGLGDVHEDIEITHIPSLVKVVNHEVEEIYVGGTSVLEVLRSLN